MGGIEKKKLNQENDKKKNNQKNEDQIWYIKNFN
jgi:hypothetical protein